ncbi:MAG: flippase-like domain-containing protein [Acidimicrobiaceae bacterium]|nr:flippase-like domain-containing protein [Acidimicrobiaceae bacterium]
MARTRRLNRRVRAALGLLWVIAVAGVAVYIVTDRSSELAGITGVFSHLNFYFLIPALVLECASVVAYTLLLKSTLLAGGVAPGFRRLLAIFLASNSINNVVPAGTAFASVYSFRRFREVGASEGLAGWAVLATNVLAALSLLVLAFIGLVISEGSVSGISLSASLASVALVILAALFVVARAETVLRATAAFLKFLERRLGTSWKMTEKVRQLTQDMKAVSPSAPRLSRAFFWGLSNWIFDALVLVIAYLATKSPIPFEGLLLAYSAGQLAATLPITPGGLGVVEGSISIALVAYGGNQEASIAAVLLYRFFSFWIWLLPGLGCYIGLRKKSPDGQLNNAAIEVLQAGKEKDE